MFHKLKRRKSMMQKMMDIDMDMDVMSAVKIVAAGALLYGTAKFIWDELMD